MTKPPAFQFYVQDFMTGTLTMTLAERGAYITLLCYQWDKGSVPGDDIGRLREILGCTLNTARHIWVRIAHKFPRDSRHFFRNARLEKERAKQRRYRKSQSNKGKLSAQRRNRGSTGVQPRPVDSRLNPSSSSSSSEVQDPPQPPADAGGRLTRKELQASKAALEASFTERRRFQTGAQTCPHEPRCARFDPDCIAREAIERRTRRRAS